MKKTNSRSGRGGQNETRPGKSAQVYKSNGMPQKSKSPSVKPTRVTKGLPAVKRRAIEKGKRQK